MQLTSDQLKLVEAVVASAARAKLRTFLVGGVVRDLLLGYSIHDKDLDVIVEGEAEPLAHACATVLGGRVVSFPRFHTAKLIGPHAVPSIAEVDFASVRVERYARPGVLPEVALARSIEEDLRRRDFTVNAIAVPLAELVRVIGGATLSPESAIAIALDQFNGIEDLRGKIIRTLHPQSFLDDPTRMFRAARYVSRLAGTLAEQTLSDMKRALELHACATVSHFRLATEIRKIATEPFWASALQLLVQWGVLPGVWGEDRVRVTHAITRWTKLESELIASKTDGVAIPKCTLDPTALYQAILVALSPTEEVARRTLWGEVQIPKRERPRLETLAERFHRPPFVASDEARSSATLSAELLLEVVDSTRTQLSERIIRG